MIIKCGLRTSSHPHSSLSGIIFHPSDQCTRQDSNLLRRLPWVVLYLVCNQWAPMVLALSNSMTMNPFKWGLI